MCAYEEQYPGSSQQRIANYFSHLWGKPIHSVFTVLDILSARKKQRNRRMQCVKMWNGAKLEALGTC